MSATGRGTVRDPLDRYDTPAWPVHRLFDYMLEHELVDLARKARHTWLEPSVGAGALVGATHDWYRRHGIVGPTFDCIDVRPRGELAVPGRAIRANFLTSKKLVLRSNYVTIFNPPFRHAYRFVEKIVPRSNLAMGLMRLSWIEGATKAEPERAAFLRQHPPDVFILPERPRFTRNGRALRDPETGERITGSDSSVYAWFVWGLNDEPHRRRAFGRWHLLAETPAEERRLLHG